MSTAFGGDDCDFVDEVTSWIDQLVDGEVETLRIESCTACGALRTQHDIPEDVEEMTDEQEVESQFLLCPPCVRHMVRANSWVLKAYGFPVGQFP